VGVIPGSHEYIHVLNDGLLYAVNIYYVPEFLSHLCHICSYGHCHTYLLSGRSNSVKPLNVIL